MILPQGLAWQLIPPPCPAGSLVKSFDRQVLLSLMPLPRLDSAPYHASGSWWAFLMQFILFHRCRSSDSPCTSAKPYPSPLSEPGAILPPQAVTSVTLFQPPARPPQLPRPAQHFPRASCLCQSWRQCSLPMVLGGCWPRTISRSPLYFPQSSHESQAMLWSISGLGCTST